MRQERRLSTEWQSTALLLFYLISIILSSLKKGYGAVICLIYYHYIISSQLKKSFSDQYKIVLRDQKNLIVQKRQHQLTRRREAQKDLLYLLSVEKWDDSLRNYIPTNEKVFPTQTASAMLLHSAYQPAPSKRTQRPRSAPPSMRRASNSNSQSQSQSNISSSAVMSNSKVRCSIQCNVVQGSVVQQHMASHFH